MYIFILLRINLYNIMNLIVIDFLSIILRMFILKKFSCYIYVYYNLRKGLNEFFIMN